MKCEMMGCPTTEGVILRTVGPGTVHFLCDVCYESEFSMACGGEERPKYEKCTCGHYIEKHQSRQTWNGGCEGCSCMQFSTAGVN